MQRQIYLEQSWIFKCEAIYDGILSVVIEIQVLQQLILSGNRRSATKYRSTSQTHRLKWKSEAQDGRAQLLT